MIHSSKTVTKPAHAPGRNSWTDLLINVIRQQ